MSDKPESWKRIASEKVADCRVFQVRADRFERESDGAHGTFYVVENPDWVNIIALTKDRRVVLIEQFRYGTEEIILEIPGGMVDEGEKAAAAARRELLEETGYSTERLVFLGRSHPNPAIQNNEIFHYLAVDCEKTAEPHFDEHESVAVRLVPFEEIGELISAGRITHSLVVAAFHYLSLNKEYES